LNINSQENKTKGVIEMNSYQKLQANFPTFSGTLRLDERQQKSLESLLAYTSGALNSYCSEIAIAKADTAKAKSIGSIEAEFKKIENRVATAKSTLHAATHQAAPKDSSEALLRFMQQKEIRDALAVMPLAQRVELALTTAQNGDGTVLQAIEGQPVTSVLVPPADMERFNEVYADRVAPEQSVMLDGAKMDLDGATAIRDLATVEMGHIENG
jgi:hypothetical protein